MQILSQTRHESGYSDDCSVTTIFHFEEYGGVAVCHTKYDGGKQYLSVTDSSEENQAKARAEALEWLNRWALPATAMGKKLESRGYDLWERSK